MRSRFMFGSGVAPTRSALVLCALVMAVLVPDAAGAQDAHAGAAEEGAAIEHRQLAPAERERIDALFAEWDRPASPGCALSVIRDGRTLLARGYGSANLDYEVPITPRTVFYLASVSKQFTAAAVALAAEQGRLSLDDDVRSWFPELPDYGAVIRVRHLVHHTSGLRDYLGLMWLAGMPFGNVWTDDDVLELIARQRALNFEPGAEFLYSNSGYFLMSVLIRRATGYSLREYTTRELFEPLGMASTWFHDDASRVVPGRAVAYGPDGDDGFRMTHLFHFDKVGSGGLYSTIEDLARWDANFYNNGIGGPDLLETLHTRGVLLSGDTLEYAFGLRLHEYRGAPIVGHGGSMMGFRTMLLRFPAERTTVITLCNLDTIDPGELTLRVADIVLADRLGPPPDDRAEVAGADGGNDNGATPVLPMAPLSAYVGSYVSPELGATYRAAIRDAALVLVRPGGVETRLTPMGGDRFETDNGLGVQFLRDGAVVIGFALDAGRVRDIRFERRLEPDRAGAQE